MTPMLRMSESLDAWGTPGFGAVFKREAESLDHTLLPLQQGMASSSHVSDTPFRVMLISVDDDPASVRIKAGVFYSGVIAGCNCADDPTPVEEQNEYCVLLFTIDKQTADSSVALLDE